MYHSYYSMLGVPRFMKEERFVKIPRTVFEPLHWSQWQKGRLDHFVNSMVGIVPTIAETSQTETSFRVGQV
jgi:hypothetical protein